MKQKEKAAVVSLLLFMIVSISLLCVLDSSKAKEKSDEKLQVVTTLFPQYDFVRQIGKDKVNVTLLLPNGEEAHAYEPTPQDMIRVRQSDMFIYTGEEMEQWAAQLVPALEDEGIGVIDLSQCVTLLSEEEENEHSEEEEHEHGHEEHHHTYDPHIWTSPVNAMKMVEEISGQLQACDPENAWFYEENASEYLAQLKNLDEQIRTLVDSTSNHTIYFGGRFALHYFFHEYGLEEIAAYDSCGEEAEPNAKRITTIIEKMKANDAKVIFYEELIDPKAARIISQQTGAQVFLFHSCHNVTKEEMEQSATYLSLMEQNLEYLKEALQ